METHPHELLHLSVMGGLATGDFNGDGLTDFYVTSPRGGNRLFQNLGNFQFKEVTQAAGLSTTDFWGTGAAFVDIEGDGDLDIYACGYRSPNRLFVNQGIDDQGVTRFQENAARFGLDFNGGSMSIAFADYDRDGDLDAYLATTAVPPPPGVKFRVQFEDGKPVIPEELREYWNILHLPGERARPTEAGQFDHFYRNDNGQFVDVTRPAGFDGAYFTLGAIWWDFNHDNWPDLYVANDYLGPDQLYLNQRDGSFKEVTQESIPHTPWSSMGMDIGDLNNDGLLDLLSTDMLGTSHYRRNVMLGEVGNKIWFFDYARPPQYSRNALYLNSGRNRMHEAAYHAGLAATDWTWGPRIEDFDEDGFQDVLFGNGMLRDVQHADLGNYADRTFKPGSREWAKFWSKQSMLKETNPAFRNTGHLRFENVSAAWGLDHHGITFGIATSDFDNDGDLDLIMNHADQPLGIYENLASNGNRIIVQLQGGNGNSAGIGAMVRARTEHREQMRYLVSSRAWLSSSVPIAHFGVGSSTNVRRLTVQWPAGEIQTFTNLPANHRFLIRQPTTASPHPPASPNDETGLFVESNMLEPIQHSPPEFDDFGPQPLLPYRISQTHYCMAWADVDQDGRQDLFLGGNPKQPARLFLQLQPGKFQLSQSSFPVPPSASDSAAAFLDVDFDGDPDLYVVRAAFEPPQGEKSHHGALYINQGSGEFKPSTNAITNLKPGGGRCLAVADADNDGDHALFIGGAPVPGQFPLAEPSRLLLNEQGSFVDNTPPAFSNLNLVSDAAWCDVNNDGRIDLIAAVERGPLHLFIHEPDGFQERTEKWGMHKHLGWWRTVAAFDLDGDGDQDLLAGNIGTNTPYQPTQDHPELLFYGNFADSNTPHIIEAYHENGVLYPRRGFDALSEAIPSLRSQFLNFHEFSQTSLQEMFSPENLTKAKVLRWNTTKSGAWINEGNNGFRFIPFPYLAQLAPINDFAIIDFNRDGIPDLVAAQNDFSMQPLTGRMDGALGTLLQGHGDGTFTAVPAARSGIVVVGESRRVHTTDLNGDGEPDLVFGIQGAGTKVFLKNMHPN